MIRKPIQVQPIRDQQRVAYPATLNAKQAQKAAERVLTAEFKDENVVPYFFVWVNGNDLILCSDEKATKRAVTAIEKGWSQ